MSLTGGALALVLALVSAQGPKAATAKRKSAAPAAASRRPAPAPVRAPAPSSGGSAPRRADPAAGDTAAGAPAAASAPAGAGAAEGGAPAAGGASKSSKTKVYTFGAMDVEGKLKTPQLLYFLNRVKLELEMSAPDHRSFMKELEKSADDSNL